MAEKGQILLIFTDNCKILVTFLLKREENFSHTIAIYGTHSYKLECQKEVAIFW
jgi:hypothetical protein